MLRNVTESVFGSQTDLDMIPVAFGDFNADKLTDVFVLIPNEAEGNLMLRILLAKSQSISIQRQEGYFVDSEQVNDGLACKYPNGDVVVSVVPADFDGDGGMDLAVVTKDKDKKGAVNTHILYGEHDQVGDKS